MTTWRHSTKVFHTDVFRWFIILSFCSILPLTNNFLNKCYNHLSQEEQNVQDESEENYVALLPTRQ